ncbi:hypothetical protein [Kangiella sp. TOML190]|uniref:hypothetical protein n=1 Tax=Kangiella sp. TOML190 TaxID=2931351 RepID=UPI0020413134|nr:hypothetical protein [Kangiella sp. TOML190]
MNEQDLIKQLAALPKEVESKNQWSSIKTAIEGLERPGELDESLESSGQSSEQSSMATTQIKPKSRRFVFPMALAASVMLVALLSINLLKAPQMPELDLAQVKTIQSLQQANNLYYSALGSKMESQQNALPESLSSTLEDLRMAQKSYRQELSQNPHDQQLFKRLIRSYETERHLLQDLLG